MTVATGRITERVQSTVEYHFRNVEWFGELRGYIIGASDDTKDRIRKYTDVVAGSILVAAVFDAAGGASGGDTLEGMFATVASEMLPAHIKCANISLGHVGFGMTKKTTKAQSWEDGGRDKHANITAMGKAADAGASTPETLAFVPHLCTTSCSCLVMLRLLASTQVLGACSAVMCHCIATMITCIQNRAYGEVCGGGDP